jgi:hypothetical protein
MNAVALCNSRRCEGDASLCIWIPPAKCKCSVPHPFRVFCGKGGMPITLFMVRINRVIWAFSFGLRDLLRGSRMVRNERDFTHGK